MFERHFVAEVATIYKNFTSGQPFKLKARNSLHFCLQQQQQQQQQKLWLNPLQCMI